MSWDPADDEDLDLYAVLGLSWGASVDEVRAAWRETARRTHPDHGGDADAFRAADHARWVLTDDGRRSAYAIARERAARRRTADRDGRSTTTGDVDGADDDDPFGSTGRSDGDDEFFSGGFVDDDDPDFATAGARGTGSTAGSDDRSAGGPFGSDSARSGPAEDWFRSAYRGPRWQCRQCFRHVLLGIDRCWEHATPGELRAAMDQAGPGCCPVLTTRNRPCRARPGTLGPPFCINHDLGWYRSGRRVPSAESSAGSRARRSASGSDGPPSSTSAGGSASGDGRARRSTTGTRRTGNPAGARVASAEAAAPLSHRAGAFGFVILFVLATATIWCAVALVRSRPGPSIVVALVALVILFGWWSARSPETVASVMAFLRVSSFVTLALAVVWELTRDRPDGSTLTVIALLWFAVRAMSRPTRARR